MSKDYLKGFEIYNELDYDELTEYPAGKFFLIPDSTVFLTTLSQSLSTIQKQRARNNINALEANLPITAGTGTKIRFDSKGLIIGTENLLYSDIPDLSSGYVNRTTNQTIDGEKTFVKDVRIGTQETPRDLYITGNIYQDGKVYAVDTKHISTEDELIYLRKDAIAAMGTGHYSGLISTKYDGLTDGALIYDKNGVARVGDISYTYSEIDITGFSRNDFNGYYYLDDGEYILITSETETQVIEALQVVYDKRIDTTNTQAIATREESPIANGIAVWDATNLRFTTESKGTAFNKDFETSSSNIKANGIASVGNSNNVARADHIHPSDPNKQNILTAGTGIVIDQDIISVDSPSTFMKKLKFNYAADGYYNYNSTNHYITTTGGYAALTEYDGSGNYTIETSTILRPENITSLIDATNDVMSSHYTLKTEFEKMFRTINITSSTLSSAQITLLTTHNCVLENSVTLGSNTYPAGTLFLKPFSYNNSLRGLVIWESKIKTYYINTLTNEIGDGATDTIISGVAQINGKAIPSYPSTTNKTYNFQYVNNALSWVEDNNLKKNTTAYTNEVVYGRNAAGTTDQMFEVSSNATASHLIKRDSNGRFKISDAVNNDEPVSLSQMNNAVAGVYKYAGSVATYADLPSSGMTNGQVYDVQADGMNYAWNSNLSRWDELGAIINLSGYALTSALNNYLALSGGTMTGTINSTVSDGEVLTKTGAGDLKIKYLDSNENLVAGLEFIEVSPVGTREPTRAGEVFYDDPEDTPQEVSSSTYVAKLYAMDSAGNYRYLKLSEDGLQYIDENSQTYDVLTSNTGVVSINGDSGEITNVAKTTSANTFTNNQIIQNTKYLSLGTPGEAQNATATGYFSLGAGQTKAVGKKGLKLLVQDSTTEQSGFGQHLASTNDLDIVTTAISSDSKISFLTHNYNSTTFTTLGTIGKNSNGDVYLDVLGDLKENGLKLSTKYAAASHTHNYLANDKVITANNITIEQGDWEQSNEISGYGYEYTFTLTGVTSNHFAQVFFDATSLATGNIADACDTNSGTITVYSKADMNATIVAVIATKVGA